MLRMNEKQKFGPSAIKTRPHICETGFEIWKGAVWLLSEFHNCADGFACMHQLKPFVDVVQSELVRDH